MTGPCFVPKAKRLFEAAIEANPSHAESLGNLAVLLHGQPCTSAATLDMIEGLYKRAIHADPANANNFSNFGLFLAEVNVRLEYTLLPHVDFVDIPARARVPILAHCPPLHLVSVLPVPYSPTPNSNCCLGANCRNGQTLLERRRYTRKPVLSTPATPIPSTTTPSCSTVASSNRRCVN